MKDNPTGNSVSPVEAHGPVLWLKSAFWGMATLALSAVLQQRSETYLIVPAIIAGLSAGLIYRETACGDWVSGGGFTMLRRQVVAAWLGCLLYTAVIGAFSRSLIDDPEPLSAGRVVLLVGTLVCDSFILGCLTVAALALSAKIKMKNVGGHLVKPILLAIGGAVGCGTIPMAIDLVAQDPGFHWGFLTAYLGLNIGILRK